MKRIDRPIPKLTLRQIDQACALVEHVAGSLMMSEATNKPAAFDSQPHNIQDKYRRLALVTVKTLMPQVR